MKPNHKKKKVKSNQNQMQGELCFDDAPVVNKKIPRQPLYAFYHGLEKNDKDIVLEFDAVPSTHVRDIPVSSRLSYLALSRIQTYNVEIRLSRAEFETYCKRYFIPRNESWLRLDLESTGVLQATVFGTDTDDSIGLAKAHLSELSKDEEKSILDRVKLPPESSVADIEKMLLLRKPKSATFVTVYNVGQGLCCAICEEHSSAPLLYFDFGCGCYQNSCTRPNNLRFCFTNKPPIILSHWHYDHYMAAQRLDKRALDRKWLVPWQQTGPTAVKFAAKLQLKGNLCVWPNNLPAINIPLGQIVKCTGCNLNTSGLAMIVNLNNNGTNHFRVLLPGDAGYDDISNIQGMQFDALVASHHGGFALGSIPNPRGNNPTCALSYGKNNTYTHPAPYVLTGITKAGWTNQLNTTNGHIALGINGNLPHLGCSGIQCDLKIMQI